MIVALLLVAGLGWWLHREGVLLPNLRRFGVAAGATIIALRLFATGQLLTGAAVAAGGVWWWVASQPKPPGAAELAAARATLGVAASADAAAIHAAWRRVIAEVHPDRGGSTERAAQVSAARDLLLRR